MTTEVDPRTTRSLQPNDRAPLRPKRARSVLAVISLIALIATYLGSATPTGAIVGGTPATASEIPWQISLQDADGHFCGGSVVSDVVIVTAAHCIEGIAAADITVVAGITDLSDTGQAREVTSIVTHPDYSETGIADIAVIILSRPLDLTGSVQPIELASSTDLNEASDGVVSGWGSTSEWDEAGSTRLLSAGVPLVDDATCNRSLSAEGESGISTDVETCAGGTGTDSCYGDSGGPLTIVAADGITRLAGVVSWGIECGSSTPGVYAEIPSLSGFISGAAAGEIAPTTNSPSDNGGADSPDLSNADEVWLDDYSDFDDFSEFDDYSDFDDFGEFDDYSDFDPGFSDSGDVWGHDHGYEVDEDFTFDEADLWSEDDTDFDHLDEFDDTFCDL